MSTQRTPNVQIDSNGLTIDGHNFSEKQSIHEYRASLGTPSRVIEAGGRPPPGHKNNLVHIFDSQGMYLTEHHASALVESVNFVFDRNECPFPIQAEYVGSLVAGEQRLGLGMTEDELRKGVKKDLPGEYHIEFGNYWIGMSFLGEKDRTGKRRQSKYLVRVSFCF